jgi:hypothetical protein
MDQQLPEVDINVMILSNVVTSIFTFMISFILGYCRDRRINKKLKINSECVDQLGKKIELHNDAIKDVFKNIPQLTPRGPSRAVTVEPIHDSGTMVEIKTYYNMETGEIEYIEN